MKRLLAALERIATALEQLVPALTQATREAHQAKAERTVSVRFCDQHQARYLDGAPGCEVWMAAREGGGHPTHCSLVDGVLYFPKRVERFEWKREG